MAQTTRKPPDDAREKPEAASTTDETEKPVVVSRKVFSDFAMI